MLIAPSEPDLIKALGNTSSVPEKFGADILFPTPQGLAGVQRKEIKDFVASVYDGRLGKEISQMQQLSYRALILEGKLLWTNDGHLMNGRSDWTKGQHYSKLMSLQGSGIFLLPTDSIKDTCNLLVKMEKWLQKDREESTSFQRPKPKGEWGKNTSSDWACHILQSFEGIGLKGAKAILKHFGGVPLKWTVSVDELMMVDGIGPKRAQSLIKSLEVEGADAE